MSVRGSLEGLSRIGILPHVVTSVLHVQHAQEGREGNMSLSRLIVCGFLDQDKETVRTGLP